MTRTYFRRWYRLDEIDRHLIWYSNDRDGMFIQPDRKVPSFASLATSESYARDRSDDRIHHNGAIASYYRCTQCWAKA